MASRFAPLLLTLGCLLCALLTAPAPADGLILQDPLEANTAGWAVTSRSGDYFLAPDADALFGYDYSALGIPEAPHTNPLDTATRGLRLRANINVGVDDQIAAWYAHSALTGRYTVQVDMWLNWSPDPLFPGLGTTQHGGLFVGEATAANPVDPAYPAQQGAGVLMSSDGECFNCDYVLLKNRAELDLYSGQYAVTDFGFGNQPGIDNTDANTNPAQGDLVSFPDALPAFNIYDKTGGAQGADTDVDQPAGAVGFRWVTLKAEVDPHAAGAGAGAQPGVVSYEMTIAESGQTIRLGGVDNSVLDECNTPEDALCTGEAPVGTEGRVSLVLVDFFASLALDPNLAFVLFDNVVITTAELPGDYNADSRVDALDYAVWREAYALGLRPASDFDQWLNNYGAGAPPPTPAPTPSAWAMLAMAVVLSHARGRGA